MPVIEEWAATHPRWEELSRVVAAQGQSTWMSFTAPWHRSSHLLVVLVADELAGFLRFVVQEIGPDIDCPPVTLDGMVLWEAKVLAFGVEPARQRQGIGTALQRALLRAARRQGCYQVRSHSGGDHPANQQLKLRLGFGVHPIVRGVDHQGVYFIMPLARRRRARRAPPPNPPDPAANPGAATTS